MHDPRESSRHTGREGTENEGYVLSTAVAEELRSMATPDLTASVLREIKRKRSAPPRAWSAPLAWLWQPVSISLRPAYAAAFALLAAVGLWTAPGFVGAPVVASESVQAPETVLVQFRLEAHGARSVELAGSFSDWNPAFSLHESLPGIWTLVVPLEAGVHDYLFVVNGEEWVSDPHAPQVDDSFGGINSRLALPSLNGRS